MTELERETILAERRRRLDMLQERRELKARIGQTVGRPDRRKWFFMLDMRFFLAETRTNRSSSKGREEKQRAGPS